MQTINRVKQVFTKRIQQLEFIPVIIAIVQFLPDLKYSVYQQQKQ